LLQPESLIQKFGRELDKITSGCSIGVNGLSVLADGTVYPCRRLPIPIANIREQTIAEIFIENSLLNQFRDFHNLKDCGECNNVTYCRGCRAIAYAVTGSAFAGDPQCFKELISI